MENNNKLIAEFLGWDINSPSTFPTYLHQEEETQGHWELKFNTDWNWLMEVVDKIESVKDKQGCTFFVEISKERVHIKYYYKGDEFDNIFIHNYKGRTKKETLYEAVVEFIKWYNEQ